jgi:hypothetical protein
VDVKGHKIEGGRAWDTSTYVFLWGEGGEGKGKD